MYPTRQCIANRQGDVSIVSISRAITIGTPQEDVALSKFTSYKHLHLKIMLFLKLKLMLLNEIRYSNNRMVYGTWNCSAHPRKKKC